MQENLGGIHSQLEGYGKRKQPNREVETMKNRDTHNAQEQDIGSTEAKTVVRGRKVEQAKPTLTCEITGRCSRFTLQTGGEGA